MSIMMKEPTLVNSTNFKLLPSKKFHSTRRGKVKAATVHVTAGLQDLGMVAPDNSAEGTNRWILNSPTEASWHRISDSDGVIPCLPSWFTAWQAKGYNSTTVGNEICNIDARWDNKPAEWIKWTIWYAALSYADFVVTYKIPLRRATKAELDAAIANDTAPVGFVDHSRLSTIRRDPGATFPWEMFFRFIKAIIAGAVHPDRLAPPTTPTRSLVPYPGHQHWIDGKDDHHVEQIQKRLTQLKLYKGKIDQSFGPATRSAVIAFQRSKRITPDGYVGPTTWKHLAIYNR